MKQVYKSDRLSIIFHPHILDSSYDIKIKPSLPQVKKNLHLIVEENTMEDLWNSADINYLGDKIRAIDEVVYMNLSRRDIERIYIAIKKVKEDCDKNIQNFSVK